METQEQDILFDEALTLFNACHYGDALAILLRLQRLVPRSSADFNLVRSYYGLTLVCLGTCDDGVAVCRDAADRELNDPQVFLNLARAAQRCGNRRLALEAISLGKVVDPANPTLRRLRLALGVRRRPVLRFLSRNNVLNVVLGKMRQRNVVQARM